MKLIKCAASSRPFLCEPGLPPVTVRAWSGRLASVVTVSAVWNDHLDGAQRAAVSPPLLLHHRYRSQPGENREITFQY